MLAIISIGLRRIPFKFVSHSANLILETISWRMRLATCR